MSTNNYGVPNPMMAEIQAKTRAMANECALSPLPDLFCQSVRQACEAQYNAIMKLGRQIDEAMVMTAVLDVPSELKVARTDTPEDCLSQREVVNLVQSNTRRIGCIIDQVDALLGRLNYL